MPFKTKRRKLKASKRHFVFNAGIVQIVDTQKEVLGKELDKKQINIAASNLSYLREDLLKIILISVFILATQIMLRLTLA